MAHPYCRLLPLAQPRSLAGSHTRGNLTYKNDAKNNTVDYSYDNLNRLYLTDYYNDTDIEYTYDQGTNGLGRLTGMTDASGTISFGYDARGRLTTKTGTMESIPYTVTQAYTSGGRLSSMTYPRNGSAITYTRNNLGKISQVDVSGMTAALVSNLAYNPFGGPRGMSTNSGGTVQNESSPCECLSVSNPGQPRERTYAYDHTGNMETIQGTTTPRYDQSFVYDNLNRLSSASARYGTVGYTYDGVGNLQTRVLNGVTETYTYLSGTNRLQQVNDGNETISLSYDANGNTTDLGDLDIIYNENNRIIRVEQGGQTLGEYTYNGLGQRVKKTAAGETTIYHYDMNGRLIAETAADGTIIVEYLYMGKVRLAMKDGPTGNIYHFLNDHLGTPEIVTDSSGTVVWEAYHLPFGETNIHPDSSIVNNFRFPGQYYDNETGFHYNYHRYYDPRTGRYLTPDPIGLVGGINLYAYVGNNPINRVDPMALIWVTADVDHHGVSNWSRGIIKLVGEWIGKGQFVFPSDQSFVGATRTITQMWKPDPENPCEDSKYSFGTLRIFDQTYIKHLRGRDDLTKNFPEPFYYRWRPYVSHRTYIDVPGAKIIDRTPYIQKPR